LNSIISHITHPYPAEILQARRDHAHITGQSFIERPFWYKNSETGHAYHDLYACIGWPSEVSDKDTGMPGYTAIVGIVRPNEELKHYNPVDANFLLLTETQSDDVPTLLGRCVEMRERYGFGIQPDLLTVWFGDPERFVTTLALRNECLVRQGDNRNAILVAPPDDFYVPMIFDNYVRSLRSCLMPGKERFYFGRNEILKNRISEFRRNDPAVLAVGGLIHSLLNRCMWMSQMEGSTVFSVEEAI
jgi:hypothetical protein